MKTPEGAGSGYCVPESDVTVNCPIGFIPPSKTARPVSVALSTAPNSPVSPIPIALWHCITIPVVNG